jgi:hypothetical protein
MGVHGPASLAVVAQLIFVVNVPDKIEISGIDLSHANSMVLVRQAIFIGCGLMLAIAAYFTKRWSSLLVVGSSMLYLVHWFPFQSAYKYGLITVYKTMFLIGSNPGLRLSFFTRDVILPIAFITSIVFVVLEMRRSRKALVPVET